MQIELIQYAPAYIKKAAAQYCPNATAYAMFRMYECETPREYPSLRDRTQEMVLAVCGLAQQTKYHEHVPVTMTGSQLKTCFDFDPVGAQYAQVYRIIFA